jgi:F-type H+-transporting ATPase subunit b
MMGFYATALSAQELPPDNILRLDSQFLIELGIQLVNITVLVVVLYLVLYKPMRRFMDARDQRIKTRLENAAQEEGRATQLREEYAQRLRDINIEREEILKKSRELGVKRTDEIISEARKEAASIYRRSMEELRMEQQNQRDDMKHAIIDISTRMAGRFVQLSLDEETQDAYVEKALEHLEEDLWYES